MRNAMLVLVMLLILLGATAQAAQPLTVGFTMPTPPYDRWGGAAAVPVAESAQLFADFQMQAVAGGGLKYEHRMGVGFRVFPVPFFYIGAGLWTPDGWRFDEDNNRYDVYGGLTWIVGLRIFAEAGATADIRYDGFGGYSVGLGLSF